MSKDKLPFKTYRARRRPWDRFRKNSFEDLGGDGQARGGGDFPPPPPPPRKPQLPPAGMPQNVPPPRTPVAPSRPQELPYEPQPLRRAAPARRRRRLRLPSRLPARRLVKYVLIWAVAWVTLSAALFIVSATIESNKISDATNAELGGGGNLLTSPGTVLVLGLDKRPPRSKEPGAAGSPARSDSMMLIRTGGGKSQRLSILRDSYADIPGYQAQKINAAYAFGGTALTVRTVENFLTNGVKINHVLIVDFERFPKLIDALGGVSVKVRERCVRSTFGGKTFRLRRGEHHLNGDRALRYARLRKNECDAREDDRDRARRQQEVMSAMKNRAFSPGTFVRLPWVAWRAPQAIITDMSPFTLSGFITSMSLGSNPRPQVLKPTGPGPGGSLLISESERAAAVRRFLE
jgi:LCP family protein required for cell wall assembly